LAELADAPDLGSGA